MALFKEGSSNHNLYRFMSQSITLQCLNLLTALQAKFYNYVWKLKMITAAYATDVSKHDLKF